MIHTRQSGQVFGRRGLDEKIEDSVSPPAVISTENSYLENCNAVNSLFSHQSKFKIKSLFFNDAPN